MKGETDEPVQIGIVVGNMEDGVTEHFISYIKPKKQVMWQASRVHGITTKDLKHAPTFLSLWPEIKRLLAGRVLIAHACGTEKRYLRSFPGHTFGPWVDSLTLSKASLPELKSHKLGSLLPYMGEEITGTDYLSKKTWHDALYDAAASFFFVKELVKDLDLYEHPTSLLLQPNTQKYHSLRG